MLAREDVRLHALSHLGASSHWPAGLKVTWSILPAQKAGQHRRGCYSMAVTLQKQFALAPMCTVRYRSWGFLVNFLVCRFETKADAVSVSYGY